MAIAIFTSTQTSYTGTAGADIIIGNNLDDTINGGAGNDIIIGLGGDDVIDGGTGNDIIDGGAGNDMLTGGTGNDSILGGAGDDNITTGDGVTNSGNNKIDGGAGNDAIEAGSGNDIIFGGSGDDNINAGDGNNIVLGGTGNDFIVAGIGDDVLVGGDGDDVILASDGNNYIFGGAGLDFIIGGEDDDYIEAGDDDDTVTAGEGDDTIIGGAGADVISGGGSTAGDESVDGNLYIVSSDDVLSGQDGNDTFRVGDEFEGLTQIDGGVSELDNAGLEARYTELEADEDTGALTALDATTGTRVSITTLAQAQQIETDVRLNLVTRPGSTALSTQATTIAGYNAVDTIEFTKDGDFSESLNFSGIERIELKSGVNITLSAEQITNNGESLDLGSINPGVHFYGVAGGPKESVTVALEYEDTTFTPAATVVGATETTYSFADFQLDDFTVADLFHNVDAIYDATEGLAGSYTRIDGANNAETVYGSEGVDNATMRLGNDVYYGGGGNDLIIGHGGADKLYGEEGNDIFVIGGFGSGVQGTTSKADDGNAEWVAGDLIVGGVGVDTLRITTGIGAIAGNNTITLNNSNFQSMEVVQVGGTVGRLNVEDAGLQLLNDHFYHRANSSVADLSNTLGNNGGSINNVVVDASGLTTNGLRFEGNANVQTFIGTTKADTFVGNGGNDVLTGNAGADTFVFGKVYEQVVTGAATTVQTYTNTAFNLTGVDTITDFSHAQGDKLELHLDQYAALAGFSAANLVVGAGATAADANDFLLFDSASNTLKYDADGNGAAAAVNIAVLTGVASIAVSDVVVV